VTGDGSLAGRRSGRFSAFRFGFGHRLFMLHQCCCAVRGVGRVVFFTGLRGPSRSFFRSGSPSSVARAVHAPPGVPPTDERINPPDLSALRRSREEVRHPQKNSAPDCGRTLLPVTRRVGNGYIRFVRHVYRSNCGSLAAAMLFPLAAREQGKAMSTARCKAHLADQNILIVRSFAAGNRQIERNPPLQRLNFTIKRPYFAVWKRSGIGF